MISKKCYCLFTILQLKLTLDAERVTKADGEANVLVKLVLLANRLTDPGVLGVSLNYRTCK